MSQIPDGILAIFTDHDYVNEYLDDIVEPMQGNKKRDWFVQHAYFCLPLVIANQMGIGIRALHDFDVYWDGGDSSKSLEVIVHQNDDMQTQDVQTIKSHFGMGTITIQNAFHFRTPPNINLMTINPPNDFKDGVHHMSGVIETDNLARDFTFNLKITRKNEWIHFKKGEFIGCVLPIQRYLADSLQPKLASDVLSKERHLEERTVGVRYGQERREVDIHKPNRNGRRYYKGIDIDGNAYSDHQTTTSRKDKIIKK